MESDRLSERSFCSLNTVNLREHTTKDVFAVNKDDTVRFYLSSLRDGFDTYAAPEVIPLREDSPIAPRRKVSEPPTQPPPTQPSPTQPQRDRQRGGGVQAKKKRRRRLSDDKENDRPPPPPPRAQADELAKSPAEPMTPQRKPAVGVHRSARASSKRRGKRMPADGAVDASPAVRGDDVGHSTGDDDEEEPDHSDPLKWFRYRSKPTVEEEFEEFKKRFVWNGSRLAASPRGSGGHAALGDGAEGHSGGEAVESNFGTLTNADPLASKGDAERTGDRRVPEARQRQRRAKDSRAPEDQRQPSTPAARALSSTAAMHTSTERSAVTSTVAVRLSPSSPEPIETADKDQSTLVRQTATTAATTSPEQSSSGSGVADSAAANLLSKQLAATESAKPLLRLPPLAAVPAAGTPQSAEPHARPAARGPAPSVSHASDAEASSAVTAVATSMDPSKLAAIKFKAKAKEPPPSPLSPVAESTLYRGHRRDSQQSTNSGGTDGASLGPVAAKVETIKLLAREKQRQRLKVKRVKQKLDSDGVKDTAMSDSQRQRWVQEQQPAAVGHEMNGRAGRDLSRWRRHGELPPLGGVTAAAAVSQAGHRSVDKRCASEVALTAEHRRSADFGDIESRAGASEVHPGRVYNLSMNFDAYVRALERMVDATLKTLAQTSEL